MPRRKGKLRLKLKPEGVSASSASLNQDVKETSTSETTRQPANTTPSSTPQRPRSRSSPKSTSSSSPPPLSESVTLQQQVESMMESQQISYPGWQEDWQDYQSLQTKYSSDPNSTLADWVLSSRLQGMLHKQQAFLGDRSHPYLKQLDALLPHLKYSGWPQDFKLALQAHYQHDNDWNRSKALFRLQQRQCVLYNKDRSHPRVVELDQIAARLTYPGHERDVQHCLELHFQYADDYIGNNVLSKQFQALRNRQAHWEGKQQPSELEQLLQLQLYDGSQQDVQATMEAHLHACSTLSNGQVMEYNTAIHYLQHKNALAQGDRSHPRIVALDRILHKAPRRLQTSPIWHQLVRECEQTHLRYATDDWIGNAIWKELLKQLVGLVEQQPQQQPPSSISSSRSEVLPPSTPLHKKPPKAVSPSSTVATAETAITASYSWSSAEEEGGDEDDDDDNDGKAEESTLASF